MMNKPTEMVTALKSARQAFQPLDFLAKVAFSGMENGATDVYLRKGTPSVYRTGGQLQPLSYDWRDVCDKDGMITEEVFNAVLTYLRDESNSSHSTSPITDPDRSFTKVYRLSSSQIRVQYSPAFLPPELMLRIQPSRPFALESYFEDGLKAATIGALNEAKGLIVVCGPIGGGKTTLQQSIVEHLATYSTSPTRLGKHVGLVADPIEYHIDNPKAVVSSCECALTQAGSRPGLRTISEVITDVFRHDIDALSVGEIREAMALDACLSFAGSSVPVITTMHGASISNCLVRIIAMAEKMMSPETARLILASCLEGMFYVNLAYPDSRKAVPVMEYLPIRGSMIPQAITSDDPITLARKVEAEQKSGVSKLPGAILRSQAIAAAKKLHKVTEHQALQALGKLIP